MKKTIFLFVVTVCMAGALSAQVDSKAIGLRLTYGGEVSYQHPLSSSNRIEANAGYSVDYGLGLSGTYQWVWDLSALATGFNWYVGAGAGVSIGDEKFYARGLGQIGIEYNFNIPLQISIDYRPSLYFVGVTGYGASDAAFSIRYKF